MSSYHWGIAAVAAGALVAVSGLVVALALARRRRRAALLVGGWSLIQLLALAAPVVSMMTLSGSAGRETSAVVLAVTLGVVLLNPLLLLLALVGPGVRKS